MIAVGAQKGNPGVSEKTGRKGQRETTDTISAGHINTRELTSLVTFLFGVKVLLTTPSFLIERAGSAAWISTAVSTLVALAGLWGWILWANETPSLGFVPALRLTLGRFLGDTLAAGLLGFFVAAISLNLRIFAGGAVIGLLPEFPLEILLAIAIIAALYAAWLGLETVARSAVFFLPLTIGSMITMFLASHRMFDLRNLLPFWGLGARTTLMQGALHTGLYGALPALMVMKTYVRSSEDLVQGSVRGVVYASVLLITGLVAVIAVFPYPMSAWKVEPLGVMVRAVYLGPFLQRIEALFMFTWFFAQAVQASFAITVILLILSQMTGTNTYRPFLPAMLSLIFGVASTPESMYRAGELWDHALVYWGSLNVILGWVLLLVARLRGVGKTQHENP